MRTTIRGLCVFFWHLARGLENFPMSTNSPVWDPTIPATIPVLSCTTVECLFRMESTQLSLLPRIMVNLFFYEIRRSGNSVL